MKYLCLVYAQETKLKSIRDDDCMDYDEMLRKSGHCIASEALQPVDTAMTVRVREGKVRCPAPMDHLPRPKSSWQDSTLSMRKT